MPISNIKAHPVFEKSYKKLPQHIKEKAKEKELIFRVNPYDARLKTHKLHGEDNDCWSFWIREQDLNWHQLENLKNEMISRRDDEDVQAHFEKEQQRNQPFFRFLVGGRILGNLLCRSSLTCLGAHITSRFANLA